MILKKYPTLLCFFLIILLTSCSSNRKTKLENSSHFEKKEEIEKVLQSYVSARQTRDLKAVKAVLDPLVDQLTSRGDWRRGIDAATAGMKRSSKKNPGNRSLKVESIRFLRADVALADAFYTIKGRGGRIEFFGVVLPLLKRLMEGG